MRAVLKLFQPSNSPVVITTSSDPSCVVTELIKVMASDLLEHLSHIAHVIEGFQLFDGQPFLILAQLHSLQELLTVLFSLLTIKRGNLGSIVAANNMEQIPLPA